MAFSHREGSAHLLLFLADSFPVYVSSVPDTVYNVIVCVSPVVGLPTTSGRVPAPRWAWPAAAIWRTPCHVMTRGGC